MPLVISSTKIVISLTMNGKSAKSITYRWCRVSGSIDLFATDIGKYPLRIPRILGIMRPHLVEAFCLSLCGSDIIEGEAHAKQL